MFRLCLGWSEIAAKTWRAMIEIRDSVDQRSTINAIIEYRIKPRIPPLRATRTLSLSLSLSLSRDKAETDKVNSRRRTTRRISWRRHVKIIRSWSAGLSECLAYRITGTSSRPRILHGSHGATWERRGRAELVGVRRGADSAIAGRGAHINGTALSPVLPVLRARCSLVCFISSFFVVRSRRYAILRSSLFLAFSPSRCFRDFSRGRRSRDPLSLSLSLSLFLSSFLRESRNHPRDHEHQHPREDLRLEDPADHDRRAEVMDYRQQQVH